MAAVLKKLAGQTAVYGLTGMLGRFLNYLLVPLHTARFIPAEYGVVTDIYALSAFGAILLTWGLETAYFRFVNRPENNAEIVLGNVLGFMLYSTLFFSALLVFFNQPIADLLLYPENPEFILWMGFALIFDAASAIPLARYRKLEKPRTFAAIQIASILVNVLLNVFFIGFVMPAGMRGEINFMTEMFYDPAIGPGYIFIANLVASAVKFLLTGRIYFKAYGRPQLAQVKALLRYSLPLMLAGFAGMINEILDRRLIRVLLEPRIGETAALAQVGIYGAVYKLSIIITLFIQAFRYAAEPFFFARADEADAKSVYVKIMNGYIIVTSFIFLTVMLYLDLFKHFISDESYWKGLYIVPILLTANILLGISYNLSVWYKLTDKTRYGAYLALIGAVITVGLNILLIPEMGYEGAAWTTLASYGTICIVSYIAGRRLFPVPYDLKRLIGYPAAAWILYLVSRVPDLTGIALYGFNTLLLLLFLAVVFRSERNMLKSLIKK